MSKLIIIMLETWNLVRKYTSTQTYGKYTFQQQDLFNLANVSTFFLKKVNIFWQKMVPLLNAIV